MRVVFIHGAFSRDGAWWWAPTAALLDRSGIASTAVALPSCGEAGVAPTDAGPGLHEDAAATAAVLDEGGPAIVVAHPTAGWSPPRQASIRRSVASCTSARSSRPSARVSPP